MMSGRYSPVLYPNLSPDPRAEPYRYTYRPIEKGSLSLVGRQEEEWV
jgi:hypothetical protein